jgi:parallel beta-helix repeat protein
MRRIVSSLIVAMLFLSMFVCVFNVQTVRAQSGIIYINADGSVSPSSAPITTVDNVTYTLKSSIINYSIFIERNNIVLDGAGYTVQGAENGTGIDLSGRSNVTIKNVTIEAFRYGVDLNSSSNSIVSGDNITNTDEGVYLLQSSNCSISGNSITSNDLGVYLLQSPNCSVSENNITNNTLVGVFLDNSSFDNVSRNNLANNAFGGGISADGFSNHEVFSGNVFTNDGLFAGLSSPNAVENNSINGKPLVYLEDVSNRTVSDAGEVVLVDCSNMVVNNLSLSSATIGVELYQTKSTRITNNSIINNLNGIYLDDSSLNSVSGNNMTDNDDGITIIYSSDNNTISGNNVIDNSAGFTLMYAYNNTLSNNNVAGSLNDIFLSESSGNRILDNNITNGLSGIDIPRSSGNRIFHNNFVDNSIQASSSGLLNTWDDGYPSGGNYWSDYTGVDEKSGPYQNLTGSDGIGDTPYVIDANNTDMYPLMGPFQTFGVGTFNGTTYSVGTVSNSTITTVSFNATVKALTFNVTGPNGTAGFCRVTILLSLMSGNWMVTVNGTQVLPPILNVTIYGNYTYIYFTYHHSTETVKITSTNVIPEFQPYMLLPLLMMMTLLTATISKRKRKVAHITKSAKE